MRNRPLHTTLKAFIEEAAVQLAAEAAEGEVPFDLVESRGLYCYRPLTDDFIRSRLGVLGRLPSYASAAQQVERFDTLPGYLQRQGENRVPEAARDRADAALRVFLNRVFEEVAAFDFEADRFERAFSELEGALHDGRATFTIAAPVFGLELESDELELGDGLALAHGDAVDDLPDEAWVGSDEETVWAVLRAEGAAGERPPVINARTRFRRLVSALRLFDTGTFALGPAAWARIDGGPWRMVPLGGSGRARTKTEVAAAAEDELRAFISLVGRRSTRGGPVAWALARFEMGCERPSPFEALSDHLLALRALLEPEGPAAVDDEPDPAGGTVWPARSGRSRLPRRLAAICAVPEQRAHLVDRVARAMALERSFIAGLAASEPGADALVDELSGHLRALLRDVLCGHLDPDLVSLAEGILEDERPRGAAVLG